MTHQEKIEKISNFLKNRQSKEPLGFFKKGISHQVPRPNVLPGKEEKLDISNLKEILEINEKEMFCIAEPGVTFEYLVRETLKHKLVPIIVPELKTITIGGAVAGCSVESASYKYGGFYDTCLELEIISARGDILNCTPLNDNKLIFEMVHGTFGTLGIISKLKFKLIPAKKYVHLKYETYSSLEDYKKIIWDYFQNQNVDYMDGIIFSPEKFVLCLGNFTDEAPYSNSYKWMKIFYKSVLKRKEDYLRTYDYFFRYDADCHWVSRNYWLENPILRFLLGKFFLGSTQMLSLAKKLTFVLKRVKPDVVVDVFVPFSRWDKFSSFYKEEFNYYPLWVVPYKINKIYPWLSEEFLKGMDDKLFIDLAIYGFKQKNNKNYYRLVEEKIKEIQGIKTLISHNSYTENEFWSIWNKNNYQEVKKNTDPDNIFNDLYHKTHRK